MATIRRVNRNQQAAYASGSKAKGYYTYSLQGIEESGASRQYFTIEGEKAATSKDAIQNAWKASREWVAEKGEVAKTENDYRVEY